MPGNESTDALSELQRFGKKITAALDYAELNGEDVRAHYLHTIQQITTELNLSDLTTSELIALKSLLIPAHSRLLTGTPCPPERNGPLLRIVRQDNAVS